MGTQMIHGNGYFIWQIKRLGDLTQAAQKAKDAGLSWVAIKVTDGPAKFGIDKDTKIDLVPDAVAAFKAVGIAVWGWGYIYGFLPDKEAQVAVDRVKDLDLAGWIIDAEKEYDNRHAEAALYMGALRTRLPKGTPVGICSWRFPKVHPECPWTEFLTADFNMPQVYWQEANNPGEQLAESVSQFETLYTHLHTAYPKVFPNASLPYFPLGAAYGENGWRPTVGEIAAFRSKATELGIDTMGWWEWYDASTIYPEYWGATTSGSTHQSNPTPIDVPTSGGETKPTGEANMSIYQNMAHMPGVDKRHTIDTATAKFPGVVIMGYDGKNGQDPSEVIDAKYAEHIDAAAKMDVPAYVVIRLFQDVWQDGWVNDPAWLDEWNSKVLDKLVMIDAAHKRTIAGIIIDARGVGFENGHVITQGNWRRCMQWFWDNAWKHYGLGQYVLMGSESISKMPADSENTAIEFMNGLAALASISVASVVTDGSDIAYPPDNWKPNYVGTNCGRVFLSYYDYNYAIAGVSGGGVDLWQYDRPAAAMYAEIGFAAKAQPVVVPTPTPVTPVPVTPASVTPSTGIDAETKSEIQTMTVEVATLVAQCTEMLAVLRKVGALLK